ncbi:MAG: hypothetical protein IJE40_00790 [Clostridia bacterium]|nr:hypothetical protein [Clostridia bacterium]
MDLRKDNKNRILKYILLCVFVAFVFAVGAAIRTVYGADIFIAYEHDKLYHEFKEGYVFTGSVPKETESKQGVTLVENENFAVRYVYIDGGFSFSIENKNSGEISLGRSELYGVNKAGETVFTYNVVGGSGYYDPYTKTWEHGVRFTEVTEDKVEIEVLLLQDFFISYRNGHQTFEPPKFMTVEDFEAFIKPLDSDLQKKFEGMYMRTTSDELNYSYRTLLWGDDGNGIAGIDMEKFSKPFYFGVPLSVRTDRYFEDAGYTEEDKRVHESKFVKKGYEAPMALARFTIDISGKELTYDAELVKAISPRNSSVTDIVVPTQIDYESVQLVDNCIKKSYSENAPKVLANIDLEYAQYPVNCEAELGQNKVDCTFILDEGFGFGTAEFRIFDSENYAEPFYSGKITEAEPLKVELPEAEFAAKTYRIFLYNESFIYQWQISVKLSSPEKLSISKKNIFYNELGNVSFDVYKDFSVEQLEVFTQSLNDYNWDKNSDYDYHEGVSRKKQQNLYEGNGELLLKYFRSDNKEARYLIQLRQRAYENKLSEDDPCIFSVEVCGDTILEPFYLEENVRYYLTITRLDDGAIEPYSLFGYKFY